jgi:DNA-binding transcriptional MerR regulator
MFRIGEFSRIAQTPISQLRYYDKIGLFQPEHIDRFTGYRYYQAAQLPDLNRILAMKELGLSLDQIHRLVVDDVSADELRGMLALKKAQVEQDLHTQLERLHHIEARLEQVEREGTLQNDDIIIKELPAQPIYSFYDTLPHLKMAAKHLMEMRKLLPSRIPQKKLSHFTAVLHSEGFAAEDVDIELGFLLHEAVDETTALSEGQELKTRILPRVEMAACVVRVGGIQNGYESYGNVGLWLDTNDYILSGPVREVFIVPPNPAKPEDTVVEIQVPVTPDRKLSLPAEL